jgi:membrane protein required for beta-lactamase induction
MSQKLDVLNYMQKHKGITSMQAFMDLGITRLASRVYELRGDGHLVLDYWVKVLGRAGREVKVKRYVVQPKGKK